MSNYEEATRSPIIPHTEAGRLFSTVRRMTEDRALGVPPHMRDTHAISVETGKCSRDMTDEEADAWYLQLCALLLSKYPDLYHQIFPESE